MFSSTGPPTQVRTSAFTTQMGIIQTWPLFSSIRRDPDCSAQRWRGSHRRRSGSSRGRPSVRSPSMRLKPPPESTCHRQALAAWVSMPRSIASPVSGSSMVRTTTTASPMR